jgi:Tfp pilus assembly protein PilF
MDTINQAIKLQPNLSQLYGFRGEIFMKMGKFNMAQEDFARACKMGAKNACARAKGLEEKMKAGKRRY